MSKITKNFDSPDFTGRINADIVQDISTSKDSLFTIDKISNHYLFENEAVFGIPILSKYENILREYTYTYRVDPDDYMRPEYTSKKLYNTTDYAPILMWLNRMKNPNEFVEPVIWVFSDGFLDVLNRILIDDEVYLRTNPKPIKKNIMKSLDIPSDKVLRDLNTDRNGIKEPLNWVNDVSKLFGKYNMHQESIMMGYLTNDNNEDVPPFTLNKNGLFNVPSIYYANGYSQHLHGKIYLKSGVNYAFTREYNGWATIDLQSNTDSSAKHITVLNKEFNQIWEPELLEDFRTTNPEAPNNDIDKTQNDSPLSYNKLKFDNETGRYYYGDNIHNSASYAISFSNKNLYDYQTNGDNKNDVGDEAEKARTLFRKDHPDEVAYLENNSYYYSDHLEFVNKSRRLDIDRIADKAYLTFNVEYSTDIKEKDYANINAVAYDVDMLYRDNKGNIEKVTSQAYSSNSAAIYNTHGERSHLLFSAYNKAADNSNKTLYAIIIRVRINGSTGVDIDVPMNIYSVGIGHREHHEMEANFTVPDTGWYNLKANYWYAEKGNQSLDSGEIKINQAKVFDLDQYTGLYFKPQLREVDKSTGTSKESQWTIMSDKTRIADSTVDFSGSLDINKNKSPYNMKTLVTSPDGTLDDDYVLVFRMKHMSKDSGGIVGQVFDYIKQNDKDTGYASIISSTKENKYTLPKSRWITWSHPVIPLYNKTAGYDVLPSGGYKLSQKDIEGAKTFPFFNGLNIMDGSYISARLSNYGARNDIHNDKISGNTLKGDNYDAGITSIVDPTYESSDGLIIKVIKEGTRVRMLVNTDPVSYDADLAYNKKNPYNSEHYDYYTPYYSILDAIDPNYSGALQFFADYAWGHYDVLEYWTHSDNYTQ